MEGMLLGIDVGGTTVKLGLFTAAGALLERQSFPTDSGDGGVRMAQEIAAAVKNCLERRKIASEAVLGCGIGIPGAVTEGRLIGHCVNLDGWGGFDLAERLRAATGFRVAVANDANAAALGECWQGAGRGCRSLLLLTLGTGVGAGIVVHGRLVEGAHGAAGEAGHIRVVPEGGRRCNCGRTGCLEQYASATAIAAIASEALASGAESSLPHDRPLTARDIFEAAGAGDCFAAAQVEHAARAIGRALAELACILDPEALLLGGGVSAAGEPLLEAVRRAYRSCCYFEVADTPILLAQLGPDAGIYGAAKLALDAAADR